MSRFKKQIEKMRANPRDWRIEELQGIAKRCGISYRQPGSSHVTFRSDLGQKVTVPAHKPIKPVYIKQFIELIEGLEKVDE